ncbi:transglycosylase domain-containing protein [Umezawaea sp. Da 62-37]|uniref:transglycosylase domain-containing protein n=1 Tax=Umezawaea sp. Da 62-37 TaxID=3075927 RepID=UPI0028F6ED75|nr:transglycosylase domain-containing protein [Umezawaea sp. Da 62-37]WNV88562.1 transglycosylase domain-containing protein [Umezawaea sp. Da 62-37]
MAEQRNDQDRPKSKRGWRRVRRVGYVLLALVVLAPVAAFAVVNEAVDVPSTTVISAQLNKVVTIRYADGTEMTRIAADGANRTLIANGRIPDDVRHAVYAAEQPDFETSSDFDFGTGLAKQYLRLVSATEGGSWRREFVDFAMTHKFSSRESKDLILTGYLDAVPLGRTAYGVVAAARMYYDKALADLTASEAAFIAGMIRNPDGADDPVYTEARWNAVMDGMVEQGWMTRDYREAQEFPAPVPVEETRLVPLDGPRALIQAEVFRELEAKGFSVERAAEMGLVVQTTIDPKAQTAAESAVDEVMAGQPSVLRQALTAVDPTKGAVRAYWAGRDALGGDFARDTLQEPGTTFLPIDLVAALEKGIGLGAKFDGTSPRAFPGRETNPVKNSGGPRACAKECSLRAGVEQDIATVFYDLAVNQVGTLAVAEAARAAGIPKSVEIANVRHDLLLAEDGSPAPDGNISLGGGQTLVRPFDMAVVYGTFAAEGVRHEPYFVEKVEDAPGRLLYQHTDVATPAFDSDPAKSRAIASNVTAALKPLPGVAGIPCANRECAGKPGTHELEGVDHSKAWMVGYTPSLAASVWVGTEEGDLALRDKAGLPVTGSGLPGLLWQRFMDRALDGTPPVAFPAPTPIGQFE